MSKDELTNGRTPVTVNDCNLRHRKTEAGIRVLKILVGMLIGVGLVNGAVNYTAAQKTSVLEAQVEARRDGTEQRLSRIEQQLDRIEQRLTK